MQPTFDILTHPDSAAPVARSFGLSRLLRGRSGAGGDSLRPGRAYSQVSAVYACVKARADALSSMPVRVSQGDDQVLESGPLVQLLERPDLTLTGRAFFRAVEAHLLLFGRTHWRFLRDAGGRPVRVTLLNPLQMRPLLDPRTNALLAWEYRPGGAAPTEVIALEELHTMVDPDFEDPASAHLGLSPRQVATMAIAQYWKADMANEASLDNGMEPGLAFKFPGKPTDEQAREFRAMLEDRHGGPAKRGRPLFLYDGLELQPFATNFKEMEFPELKRMSRTDICAAFSVPPAVIGYYEDSNYAHAQAAMEGFWINTILPRAVWIAEEWDLAVTAAYEGDRSLSLAQAARRRLARHECRAPLFRRAQDTARRATRRYFTWFDASSVPAVQRAQLAISEQAMKWITAGVPLNDILRAHDLPYSETAWGDTWFKNIGLVDVRYDEPPGANDPSDLDALDPQDMPTPPETPAPRDTPEAPKPTGAAVRGAGRHGNPAGSSRGASGRAGGIAEGVEARKATEAQLGHLWHQWRASWTALERHARGVVKRHAHELRSQVLENLRRLQGALPTGKGLGGIERRDLIGQLLFDLVEANGRLLAKFRPLLRESARLGGEQSMDEAATASGQDQPDPFRIADPEVTAALRRRELRITDMNRRLRNQLRDALVEALEQNLTTDQIADALRAKFNGLGNRAAVIARTEIGAAVEEGRAVGRVQAGVPMKSWLWSRKENGRRTHGKIEDQTMAQPLAQQAEFVFPETGNTAPYPRATGDPRDDVNCGCTTIGRYPDDDIRAVLARYQTRGFLTYPALLRRGDAPPAAARNSQHESQP